MRRHNMVVILSLFLRTPLPSFKPFLPTFPSPSPPYQQLHTRTRHIDPDEVGEDCFGCNCLFVDLQDRIPSLYLA